MKKSLAILLALIMTLMLVPTVALAEGGNGKPGGNGGQTQTSYGNNYGHIDVKVDGTYSVTVDGTKYDITGTLQADSIKVQIGNTTYDFSRYNVRTQSESSESEYEITVNLSPSSIAWKTNTYEMTNVVVSARMLFETVPDALKEILPKTTISQKTYYYADIKNMQYTGVQECTGGNGMRSKGNTGMPTGLDLYIKAEDAGTYITKGKLAIQKKIVNENETAVQDATKFTFTVKGHNYDKTVEVEGGKTVTLENLTPGSYRVTETQQTGYAICSIDDEETPDYSKDYTIVAKTDAEIPVATFTNTKLTNNSSVNIKKTASGLPEGTAYPNPSISIYAADNEGKKSGDAIWSGTLTANGDTLYLTKLFDTGTYVVEETGADVNGYDCNTTLSVTKDGTAAVSTGMTFTVSKKGKTYSLTVNNEYKTKEEEPTGSLTISKTVTGLDNDSEKPDSFTFKIYKEGAGGQDTVVLNKKDDGTYESSTPQKLKYGEYTVEEIGGDVQGYNHSTNFTGNKTTVTVSKETPDVTVNFTNKYEEIPSGTGTLVVRKTVSGGGADYNKAFTFTVTLEKEEVKPKSNQVNVMVFSSDPTTVTVNTYEVTYGGVTFKDGVATFTLKHNQERMITDIPAEMKYTVTESDNSGYTVTKSGDTGTIEAGGTATAAFNNYKAGGGSSHHYYPNPTPIPPIIVNPPKTGDMTIWQSILAFLGII